MNKKFLTLLTLFFVFNKIYTECCQSTPVKENIRKINDNLNHLSMKVENFESENTKKKNYCLNN